MAICRLCAWFSSHQAVSLQRPCRRNTKGRQARLKRFMLGRHPEPGLKHVQIDGVQHFRPGGFLCTVGSKTAAASHEGHQSGMGAGREVPPPPLPFGTDPGHDGSASGDAAEAPSDVADAFLSNDPALFVSFEPPCDESCELQLLDGYEGFD